jgi:transposase-like protein
MICIAIVWLDSMHYKVKGQGKVKNGAVYNILGINIVGKKDFYVFTYRIARELVSGPVY